MTKKARETFLDLLGQNRRGAGTGVYSVCSAHPDVLESCLLQARQDNSIIIIESTSNQVDQFGGYTGMKPADFSRYIASLAGKTGFPLNRVLLGGDHLGPNAWQSLPAEEAMNRADDLIAAYVRAGYLKIHLDTSMFLADDKGDRHSTLADEIVASRAARLCRIAEKTWEKTFHSDPELIYIIGTEVPVPGGAKGKEETLNPTSPRDAAVTLEITRNHFLNAGLSGAWSRVAGIVVQPGVEFGDDQIFNYEREKAKTLSLKILEYDNLVFEAHSTDYQSESCLKALVEDHFCILKVGPWFTFAYREALFALEAIETEIMGTRSESLSRLGHTLEKVMNKDPRYWIKYYPGNESQQLLKRKYSFSDRSRYYWTDPELEDSKTRLIQNLRNQEIPKSLLSQFMPSEFYEVCEGKISGDPKDLIQSHIRKVAGIYSRACRMNKG